MFWWVLIIGAVVTAVILLISALSCIPTLSNLPWSQCSVDLRVSALSVTGAAAALNGHGSHALATTARGVQLYSGLAPATAIQSAGPSSYAVLDRLVLNSPYVRIAPVSGRTTNHNNLFSTRWGANRVVTLVPNSSNIALTGLIENVKAGPCYAADFEFWLDWSIQGFCRTANKFVYTTAAGPVALPETPSTMPSDYAPQRFDFMDGFAFVPDNGNEAESTLAQRHMSFINSVYDFDVDYTSTVNLLVDINNVVACYDGTVTHGPLVDPLGADSFFPGTNSSWNWSAPAFAFAPWTLPVFVDVTNGGAGSVAVGETYIFAARADLLPVGGAAIEWANVSTATVTWSSTDAAADLLDMRLRGHASGNTPVLGVWGGYFAPKKSADGSWQVYNGQQKYWDYTMLAERTITGFRRADAGDYTTVRNVTVVAGPECGADPGHNQTRSTCPTVGSTFAYVQWKRI